MSKNERASLSGPSKSDRATRRTFLARGAAIGAALAVPAAAVAGADDKAQPTGAVSVRDFGALGDGETDDTQALQKAVAAAQQQSLGTVFLPAGTYLISDAIQLPDNVCLQGAGPGLTTLRAVPETRFPLFKPDPRTQEIRQRRSMITTAGVGSVRETVTTQIGIARLTIDWNHCPTDGYGSSCILIDSADHCRLDQVHFARCMPSDHPRRLEEMKGSGFRSECIMFSNARHAVMDGCHLVDSGYRPLSVSYGSQDITFQNGKIVATNPVWRHAFAEVHGDKIPRDEHYVRSQVKFLNSTFILEGGTAQDGICSHTGTVLIENCDFYIRGGTEHFAYVVKPFDASWRCQCLNNRFHCEGDFEQRFSIIGSIGDKQNEDMLFAGNIVNVHFREGVGADRADRGLVDFSRNEKRCRVQDNQFLVQFDEAVPMPAIRLENAQAFTVADNQIEFRGPDGQALPVGITVDHCRVGTVTGNLVMGDCQVGVLLGENLEQVAASNNLQPEISETPTTTTASETPNANEADPAP